MGIFLKIDYGDGKNYKLDVPTLLMLKYKVNSMGVEMVLK